MRIQQESRASGNFDRCRRRLGCGFRRALGTLLGAALVICTSCTTQTADPPEPVQIDESEIIERGGKGRGRSRARAANRRARAANRRGTPTMPSGRGRQGSTGDSPSAPSCEDIEQVRRTFNSCCGGKRSQAVAPLCETVYAEFLERATRPTTQTPRDFRNTALVQAEVHTSEQVALLQKLEASGAIQFAQPFLHTEASLRARRVSFHMRDEDSESVSRYLARAKITARPIIENLSDQFDAQFDARWWCEDGCCDFYQTYESISDWVSSTFGRYHEYGVFLATEGESFEGRSIRSLQIEGNSHDFLRPTIIINAGIHAREWLGVASVMHAIDDLLADYQAGDPEAVQILTDVRLLVLPVLNPDGYAFTWSDDRMWRKNRQIFDDAPESCVLHSADPVGVDLNRNGVAGWDDCVGECIMAYDYCDEGSYQVFRGPEPLVAPELQTLIAAIERMGISARGHMDVHTFSQYVLHPHAYTPHPSAHSEHASTSLDMAAAMTDEHGQEYVGGEAYSILYPAGGTTMDHVYQELGITHAYTLEMRPDPYNPWHFAPPPSQICPTADEVRAAISVLSEQLASEWPW